MLRATGRLVTQTCRCRPKCMEVRLGRLRSLCRKARGLQPTSRATPPLRARSLATADRLWSRRRATTSAKDSHAPWQQTLIILAWVCWGLNVSSRPQRSSRRSPIVSTARAASEAGKWSGVQTISFPAAGAARENSARLGTLAGQLTPLESAALSDWSAAVSEDGAAGLTGPPSTRFEPDPGTRSGFRFLRIRPGFRAAMTDWLEASRMTI